MLHLCFCGPLESLTLKRVVLEKLPWQEGFPSSCSGVLACFTMLLTPETVGVIQLLAEKDGESRGGFLGPNTGGLLSVTTQSPEYRVGATPGGAAGWLKMPSSRPFPGKGLVLSLLP